jgi:hypothetical protein
MLDGFKRVIYWAGLVIGVLLVLAAIGAFNQHAKLLSMLAVGDGLADLFRWAGSLLSQTLGHL